MAVYQMALLAQADSRIEAFLTELEELRERFLEIDREAGDTTRVEEAMDEIAERLDQAARIPEWCARAQANHLPVKVFV